MAHANRPKWLVALEAADDDEKLLASIADAEEPAVQGLLRRHGLRDPGLQSERVQVVEEALSDGSLTVKDLFTWREDVLAVESAVEGIGDFRKKHPLIEEFRVKHKLPPGNDATVLATIRESLWRGDFPLGEWVEFLDKHREKTHRHLFLFRLPAGDIDLHNLTPSFKWKTQQPELVYLESDPAGKKLQWVGWRAPAKANDKARRSVTFVRLDMKRRTMELQLQRMRGGGMLALLAERDTYLREAATVLQLRPEPIRLEPAIRSLLRDKRLTLTYWMVRTPEGGELSGKGEPGLFERARLGFERFYALELRGKWKASETSEVTVWMNARTDAIDIRAQCEPIVLDELISIVCQHVEAAPQVAVAGPLQPPVTPAENERLPYLKETLEKVIEYQRRLGEDVDISNPSKTTNDLLFSPKTLEEALNRFGVRSLGVTLYIMCPRTSTPAYRDGLMVEFERPDDIPEEIDCENKGEMHRHSTKGNVWLKIGPDTSLSGSSPRTIWVAFAVFFPVLTWFFVWLRNAYPKQGLFILIGYVLAAIAPVAAIRWIYGPHAFEAAVDLMRALLDVLLRRRGSGAGDRPESTPPGDEDDGPEDDER